MSIPVEDVIIGHQCYGYWYKPGETATPVGTTSSRKLYNGD
jgi:hypothetical protein